MEKWENAAFGGENLMAAHVSFAEEAVSLNGNWRFFSQSSDLALPEGWEKPEYNDKKWSRISVPGSWESEEVCPVLNGRSSLPPACLSPSEGRIDPAKNLTGLYRRSFLLSKDQGSRQIILRFEAIRSCALVWVNDTCVGMAKGMRTPAEFDITPAVCPGKNVICVQVLRYSDATYLEPEGQFLSSGILGDVTLYSLPARAITRLEATTRWQEDCTPLLCVSLDARDAEDFTARIALMDGNRVVGYCECDITDGHAEAELPCPDVELWCAEHPKLYRVAVILWDGIAMYHTRELTVGFRRVEQQDDSVLLNGQPEKLFAAEYRPFDPETGCFPSAEQMEQDLTILRAHHLNAIMLTSFAPDTLYALCDRLGVYVLDKTGVDGSKPLWNGHAQEQNHRIAQTFGSHPCIIAWNAETHPGILSMEQISVVKDPAHGDIRLLLGLELGSSSDAETKKRKSPMKQEASGPRTVLLSLPCIPGGMDQIISGIRNSPNVLGAVFGAFRGERFGSSVSSGAAGLMAPDGTPTALLRELRVLLQPMAFAYDAGTLTVTNLSRFRSTEGYQCRYLLTRDGETIVSRDLELTAGPGASVTLFLETQYDIFKAGRYHLTVGYVNPETGASIASAQWEAAHLRHIFDENPGGTIREEQGAYLLRSRDSAYTVSRATGALEQICLEDRPILTGPASPVFASEADRGIGFLRSDEWEKLTFGRKKLKPSVLEVDHMTRTVSGSYKLGSGLIQNFRLYSDGSIGCELRLRTGRTVPSLIGVCLPLDPALHCFRWFGLGPDDAAPDHQAGRFFSTHSQNGPSDSNGMKDPVYQLTVTDEAGFGVMIRSEEGIRAAYRKNGQDCQLLLELSVSELKPHTTYTFPFIIQPIRA